MLGRRKLGAARYGGEVPDTETKKVNAGAVEGGRRQLRAPVERGREGVTLFPTVEREERKA